jgi:sulfoxide reductase heme-binding subunit YedZ
MKWKRAKKRLWRHHLPLLVASVVLCGILYNTLDSEDPRWLLSMSTAYVGLVWVAVTLLLGPWVILREKRATLSFDLRRDVGIWAGIVSLVHVAVGVQVHFYGKPWLYFVSDEWTFPFVRTDLFGGANYTGLFATIIIAVLLALSNDLSIRKLGKRWKALQRWNYAGFALVMLHGWAYQAVENRPFPFVVVLSALGLVVLVVQAAAFWHRRHADYPQGK